MRITPKKIIFGFVGAITFVPRKICSGVSRAAHSVFCHLPGRKKSAKRLTPEQVSLLRDIKNHKFSYVMTRDREGAPPRVAAATTPLQSAMPPLRSDTEDPQFEETFYEPSGLPENLERLRETIREIAGAGASAFYQEKIRPLLITRSEQGIPEEIDETIQKVCEPLLLALRAVQRNYKGGNVDHKPLNKAVRLLFDHMRELYSRDLDELMEEMIVLNTSLITDSLAVRALRLVEACEFGETVDAVGRAVCEHVDGLTIAHNETLTLLNQLKNPLMRNENAAVSERFALLRERIAEPGGEEEVRGEILLKSFVRQPACDPFICAITSEEQETVENDLDRVLTDIANELLTILMPMRPQGNGTDAQMVSGFHSLWEQLEWPEELTSLKDDLMNIIEELLPQNCVAGAETIRKKTLDLIEACVVSAIEDKVRKAVAERLKKAFFYFTNPTELEKVAAAVLLPRLQESLIVQVASTHMMIKADTTAPIFLRWLNNPNDEDDCRQRLLDVLFKECEALDKSFKPEKGAISKEDFEEIVEPWLEDTYEMMVRHCEEETDKCTTDRLLIKGIMLDAITLAHGMFDRHSSKKARNEADKVLTNLCKRVREQQAISQQSKNSITRAIQGRKNALLGDLASRSKEPEEICNEFIELVRTGQKNEVYSLSSIKAQLRSYIDYEGVDINNAPPYGGMMQKLIFDIGKLQPGGVLGSAAINSSKIQDTIKNNLGKGVLDVLEPFRGDYVEPMAMLAAFLEELQDKEKVKRLLFTQETRVLPAQVDENRMEQEVKKVSLLARDLLKETVNEKAGFLSFPGLGSFANKMILPKTKEFENTFHRCLVIYSNQMINMSLAMRIKDLLLDAARDADLQAAIT